MRTTKRFTPNVLDRYRASGRGLGTFEDFIPWHRVSRGDPASRGRSHLVAWRGRHYELLSDGEHIAFLFAAPLLSANDDLREQFPLSLDYAMHELGAYDVRHASVKYPGTLEIASHLGIKHPMCHGDGRTEPWVMTTDQLIMRHHPDGSRSLQAIACKDSTKLSKRSKELLQLEREYWHARGANWMLLTPNEYHPLVGLTLQRTWPWALAEQVSEESLAVASRAIAEGAGRSLTAVLSRISDYLQDEQIAQRALWQSVWWGMSPVDLRRGWRPHLPLVPMDSTAFIELNPIASGRSSWI